MTIVNRNVHKLFGLTLAVVIASGMTPVAHAAKGKAIKESREKLVLMPLRVAEEDKSLQGAMETALVEGLQQKYEVFSGERVAQKAREIFMKESRNTAKKECDETRCMQGIAEAFQAELIATANVTKQGGGYFLALSIQNIFDNKVEYSKTLTCEGCNAFKVVDKLKELVGTPALVAAEPAPEEPQPKVNLNDPDGVLWAEAQKGNSVEDYQVYLDTYPKGKYVPFAKVRIKKIKEAAQAAAAQQEQQAWDTAQQENSEASYGLYLKDYPTGRFAGLAKVRMDKLKNDVVAREEAEVWKKADSSNDKASVENYLNKYPSGRYLAAADAKLKLIKEEEARFPPLEMVRIPGKNYELGKYEVTQKQWRAIMGSNPSSSSSCGDTCPVEQVSWDDEQVFIQKLNARTGKQYRLPTEAEWEYACYGGSQSKYCGGNDVNAVAWYGDNSNNTTHPAGQKQANGYGLYDMSGNVWEWTSDCWEGDCAKRVLRGGSWFSRPWDVRSAFRDWFEAARRFSYLGFRLARTLP